MAQRIQADAPCQVGRRIAEMPRHIAVGGFVQGNGEKDRNGIDRQGLDQIFHVGMN